jgi:hypothetical protein
MLGKLKVARPMICKVVRQNIEAYMNVRPARRTRPEIALELPEIRASLSSA